MSISLAEEQTLLEKYTEGTVLHNMINFHFSIWHIILLWALLQCTVSCHNLKEITSKCKIWHVKAVMLNFIQLQSIKFVHLDVLPGQVWQE